MISLISIIILIGLIVLGLPIGMSFFATALFIVTQGGYETSFLLPYGYSKMGSLAIIAIPMFILAGGIIEKGGIGEKLVNFVDLFVGHVKGGMAAVMIVTCALFGSITGSAAATMSVIGSIMLPRLEKAGYNKGYSAALISNCCLLGGIIPPSGLIILYCWAGNVSVIECFLALVIPGIITTVFFCIANYFMCKNDENIIVTHRMERQAFNKELVKRTKESIPAFIFPIIILGGIYAGIMTPTESASVAVIYAIVVAFFVYKTMSRSDFFNSIVKSMTTVGTVLVMIFSVNMLGRLYIMEDIPNLIVNLLQSVSDNKYVVLLIINIVLIGVGMLMDDISATLLATPILLPIIKAFGVDPVHFAVIIVVNLGLGCVTPPCAPLLYLGAHIGESNIFDMLKPNFLLILCVWVPILLLVTYIPELSTFLPNLLLG